MSKGSKTQKISTKEERLAQALVPVEEQPYPVPENWCWIRLSALSKIISKGTTPSGGKNIYTNVGVAFLRVENLNEDGTISHENIAHIPEDVHSHLLKRSILEERDILISIAGTLGKTGIVRNVDLPLNTNQALAFVRLVNMEINEKYIKYCIDNPATQNLLLEKAKVTSIPNLTLEIIGNCYIPLSPVAEQKRIVDRIENLFAKLDEAKEKAQSVVNSFEIRKEAILHEAFTGKLTKCWRQQRLFDLKEWKHIAIGDLTDIISSKRIYKEEYTDKGVPFYRSSEIVDLYDTGYTTPLFFISRDRYGEIKAKYGVPKQGDLLVTSVGTIGKTWIVDNREFYYKDGNLTQVKQCDKLNMKYLQYFIMSNEFSEQVVDTVAGSAYNALTIIKFKRIIIPLPSISEQNEIVRILDIIFAKEQQVKETNEIVLEQIDTMKKSILARAFRSELGTNDPAEESVVELLKDFLIKKEVS